ncbi:HEAT repeat domain-containing protein [Bacillus sp. CGMCC 1.16607]|uniref:HEAT repeat domain-containing protein n=1 Tax=Bacillus sp. CGMCC 1.16607 TaxID=3351842 RepID=UPI003631A685
MWENELLYLSIATVIILVIQSLILLYLIIRKSYEIRVGLKVDKHKKRYNERLMSYLIDGEVSRVSLPNTNEKKRALEELLSKYAEILEGKEEKKNLFFLVDLYLADYYKDLLKSNKWSKRMNALYHIEEFNILTLENEVINVIKKKRVTKDEIVHGLRILSLFQNKNIFNELAINHTQLSEYDYRSILFVGNENHLDMFVLGFHNCQPALKNAILDMIGLKKELKYSPFLESVFKSSSGEERLRALKALAAIGYVKDISKYLPLCKSSNWQERMMIAKLLGKVKEKESISCLRDLLHDSIWYVRSQAAQAIKHFPNGQTILKDIYNTSNDHFAKDMAWEWINKGD